MDLDQLAQTAAAMVQRGKGVLAADDSSGTIKKRFDAIGVESSGQATWREWQRQLGLGA